MMRFICITVVTVLSSLQLSCTDHESANHGLVYNVSLSDQNGGREYVDWQNATIVDINSINDSELYNPLIVRVLDSRIYMADYGDLKVKEYTLDGHFVQSYGSPGSGPGELSNINDIFVLNREVYILDTNRRRLNIFGKDGSFLSDTLFNKHVARICMLSESKIVFKTIIPNSLFISIDNGEEHDFGHIFTNQDDMFMAADGFIDCNSSIMVYSPFYYDALFSFSDTGDLKWAAKTISKNREHPDITKRSVDGGLSVGISNKNFISNSISIDEGRIYIHALADSKDFERSLIDVYNLYDGSYEITISLDRLYTYCVASGKAVICAVDGNAYIIKGQDFSTNSI